FQFVVRYFVRFFLASLTASVYERSDARFVQQSRITEQVLNLIEMWIFNRNSITDSNRIKMELSVV
ncbi:MAG: hypothetical protein RJB37_170, partial [Pseudomonadota bacterium]